MLREPTADDLCDAAIAVVDVGSEHALEILIITSFWLIIRWCVLSLVPQHLGIYEDARQFCEWLEPGEWFDTHGPNVTVKWLDVDLETMGNLNSQIDVTLLRRFAKVKRLEPVKPLCEMLRCIGADRIACVREMRARLDFIA